jgi:hypothetical protein
MFVCYGISYQAACELLHRGFNLKRRNNCDLRPQISISISTKCVLQKSRSLGVTKIFVSEVDNFASDYVLYCSHCESELATLTTCTEAFKLPLLRQSKKLK